VITIQPEFCAFVLFNITPATTPSPKMIINAVPMTSAANGFMRLLHERILICEQR
jgi:hypothetical protein